MSKTFDKERLRRAFSDEAGMQNEFHVENNTEHPLAIRIIPRSRRDGTNWVALALLEATACTDTHFFLTDLNGRLCYVTAPITMSVKEAVKAIQDAEDAVREPFDTSLLTGLNEHSQPVSKDKQKHSWYKFNQRNKYGRK